MSQELPRAYKQFKKIMKKMGATYGLSVATAMDNKDTVRTHASQIHQIHLRDVENIDNARELIARAKVNELACCDLGSIKINNSQLVGNIEVAAFKNVTEILISLWTHTIASSILSQEQLDGELEELKKGYLRSDRKKPPEIGSLLNKYLILRKYDLVKEELNGGRIISKIIDAVKKYGDKEPALHYIAMFYNELGFEKQVCLMHDGSIELLSEKEVIPRGRIVEVC